MLLLDHILNKKFGKPFIKMPPDDALAVLQPAEVVRIEIDHILLLESTVIWEIQEACVENGFK